MQTKINWFEIPAHDFGRAVKFYETVFDLKLRVEPYGNAELGVFTPSEGNSIGAVAHGEGFIPGAGGVLVYFDAGESIDRVLARIGAAGGRVVLPKTALPQDMGYIAHFVDCEGNRVALHGMA